MDDAMVSIFRDLQVLEFASALAGPITGTFLAELGAQVIKLEPPAGDVSRSWRIARESTSSKHSFYYCAVNGNKKTQEVNLHRFSPFLVKLIKQADIIITNFSAKKSKQFKLNYQAVQQINPNIILANITGFGQDDERPAFDVLLQAESGIMSINGTPDHWPIRIPIPIVDILCGHQLKQGILCALIKRMKTGQGSELQVSLYDSILSGLNQVASNYLMGNQVAQPSGTQHPSIAPYGDLFVTRDKKQIILAVGSEAQFGRLCKGLGCVHLLEDRRFSDNKSRIKFRSELNDILGKIIAKDDLITWQDIFRKNKIPAGPIYTIAEALGSTHAKRNIICEKMPDGVMSVRMRQVVF